jgi:hypothetical protein
MFVYYNFIGLLFLAFVSESICVLPYCPTFPIVNCEADERGNTQFRLRAFSCVRELVLFLREWFKGIFCDLQSRVTRVFEQGKQRPPLYSYRRWSYIGKSHLTYHGDDPGSLLLVWLSGCILAY